MVRIVCVSDTHCMLDRIEEFPEGDILLHSGDMLSRGTLNELAGELAVLVNRCQYEDIVFIAGNHDWAWENKSDRARQYLDRYRKFAEPRRIHYLEDESVTLHGLKFYGSPWQPEFYSWAFNLPRDGEEIRDRWAAIPEDTDVLITHGPPADILDACHPRYGVNPDGSLRRVGCAPLREAALYRVKPKLHVFGHIHGSYGLEKHGSTMFVNASTNDHAYRPVNPPIVVDVEDGEVRLVSGGGTR